MNFYYTYYQLKTVTFHYSKWTHNLIYPILARNILLSIIEKSAWAQHCFSNGLYLFDTFVLMLRFPVLVFEKKNARRKTFRSMYFLMKGRIYIHITLLLIGRYFYYYYLLIVVGNCLRKKFRFSIVPLRKSKKEKKMKTNVRSRDETALIALHTQKKALNFYRCFDTIQKCLKREHFFSKL